MVKFCLNVDIKINASISDYWQLTSYEEQYFCKFEFSVEAVV